MSERVPTVDAINARIQLLTDGLNHQNDAICAIVATAYMESALGALLRAFLITGDISEAVLDPVKGCIGPFQNKANMAYCLGLISKGCLHNITVIGKIRNLFAHVLETDSFGKTEVSELCEKLRYPGIDHTQPPPKEPPSLIENICMSARGRFVAVSMIVCTQILIKGLETTHRDRGHDLWG